MRTVEGSTVTGDSGNFPQTPAPFVQSSSTRSCARGDGFRAAAMTPAARVPRGPGDGVPLAPDQGVSCQRAMYPTSMDARSCTRSFHVPLSGCAEASTVKVWSTLSAEPPLRLSRE